MAVPEVESLPQWVQNVVGGVAFLGMIGAMVMRFVDGQKKSEQEQPKHVIVEQAEIADLSVLRSIAPKLEQVLGLQQKIDDQKEDLNAMADRQRRILDILDRIDRKEEMRALIREAQRGPDDQGQGRRQ